MASSSETSTSPSGQGDFILIKGATIITVNSEEDILENCDILVQGDRIAALGKNLPQPEGLTGEVIDGMDSIVIPGFVDGHHHMWQQMLRGVATDWSLLDYMISMRSVYGSLFTPEDVYLSTYIGALSLLNNGITSVLDHCHIINSPDHADAAVKALKDAGIRGTFCYGFYANPPSDDSGASAAAAFTHSERLADAARIREKYFGDNHPGRQLLTFGVAPNEVEVQEFDDTAREIAEARGLGARIVTMHVAHGPMDLLHKQTVQKLADAGELKSDLVFAHGASLTDNEIGEIKTSGAGVVSTPDTELQMGMGFPVAFRARDGGCRAGLGIDITSNQGNDFIAQMRLALQTQRAVENEKRVPVTVSRKTSEVLRMATIGGAEVMRIDDLVGHLAVGMKADVVMIKCNDIESSPVASATGAVVFNASVGHIDTVIVNGQVKKRNGKLVADWEPLRDQMRHRAAAIKTEAAGHDLEAARERWMSAVKL
ncbi:Amidohydro-rel domain-containing protein [Fusarium falciforme]|uniref:Amidohydro-rel domain-containing protein n=1 Tax=Fusarium falciforme TaxID=195108 RepID=UPI0023011DD9|nr:Amidohydro-rel domain-containing protein [Fusarium falciforme]WAO91804.1 Amidohydro-rel domain-containing protein [Fusarium falciforme]